jgi:hypothetical protein
MPSWLGKKFPAQVGTYTCALPPNRPGRVYCSNANMTISIARPYAPFFAAGMCELDRLLLPEYVVLADLSWNWAHGSGCTME